MKKLFFAVMVLIGGLQTSIAQTQAGNQVSPTEAEQQVLDLSKKKWEWMAKKNADSLHILFHAKAMFVHMGGSWEDGVTHFLKTHETSETKGW